MQNSLELVRFEIPYKLIGSFNKCEESISFHTLSNIVPFFSMHSLDTGNSLTEVEKKLLLLCQSQTSLSTNETEDENQTSLSPNDVCTSGEPNLPSTHGNYMKLLIKHL